MTVTEQRRAWVLARVLRGIPTMAQAGEELGLSERHLWRLRVAFEREGNASSGVPTVAAARCRSNAVVELP